MTGGHNTKIFFCQPLMTVYVSTDDLLLFYSRVKTNVCLLTAFVRSGVIRERRFRIHNRELGGVHISHGSKDTQGSGTKRVIIEQAVFSGKTFTVPVTFDCSVCVLCDLYTVTISYPCLPG